MEGEDIEGTISKALEAAVDSEAVEIPTGNTHDDARDDAQNGAHEDIHDDTQILLSFGKPIDDPDFLHELQFRLWDGLLGRPTATLQFPGSQPVSFARHHLAWLENEDYFVCEKSDGIRYLLYFTAPYGQPTAFLINRHFEARELSGLTLPARNLDDIHEETLLDGELICERNASGGKEFIFMIFDCLLVNGLNVMKQSLPGRLKWVQNDIVAPFKTRFPDASREYPFNVDIKKMYKPYGIADILINEIPKLRHENDGLIFTPVADPYRAGTCERLLKWKPSELNTVDFKLIVDPEASPEQRYTLHVATKNGQHRWFAYHRFDPKLDQLDGAIMECRYSPPSDEEPGGWEFVRVRADKVTANYERVVDKIIGSIRDNVTSHELISRIPAIRRKYKAREMASAGKSPVPDERDHKRQRRE